MNKMTKKRDLETSNEEIESKIEIYMKNYWKFATYWPIENFWLFGKKSTPSQWSMFRINGQRMSADVGP